MKILGKFDDFYYSENNKHHSLTINRVGKITNNFRIEKRKKICLSFFLIEHLENNIKLILINLFVSFIIFSWHKYSRRPQTACCPISLQAWFLPIWNYFFFFKRSFWIKGRVQGLSSFGDFLLVLVLFLFLGGIK